MFHRKIVLVRPSFSDVYHFLHNKFILILYELWIIAHIERVTS